jgi:hypothetical protein
LATWERYARLLDERGDVEAARRACEGILDEIGDDDQLPSPTLRRRILERLVSLADRASDAGARTRWKQRLDALDALARR